MWKGWKIRLVVKKNHCLHVPSNILFGKHSELSDGCKKSFFFMCKSLFGVGARIRRAQRWGLRAGRSQSPAVAVFTRRKSNKLQKSCAAHAMRIQSCLTTNHSCSKFKFPRTVSTWIMSCGFFFFFSSQRCNLLKWWFWPFYFYELGFFAALFV